ncbi:MAG: hypothetical protein IPL53_22645 [Ignavibacteria bacterium]|nr:hypothetical protein [Ignavibacteria bacterium]
MTSPQDFTPDDEKNQIELSLKKADLKIKKWDLVFKVFGLLALIFGIVWPLYQYTNTLEKERTDGVEKQKLEQVQKDKEIDAALREARKPFLELQQKLYFEATTTASKIATLPPGLEREEAKKKFYQLYWGELSVVEDSIVEQAMVKFMNALQDNKPQNELQSASLNLARSCRNSLARGWGYDRGAAK